MNKEELVLAVQEVIVWRKDYRVRIFRQDISLITIHKTKYGYSFSVCLYVWRAMLSFTFGWFSEDE